MSSLISFFELNTLVEKTILEGNHINKFHIDAYSPPDPDKLTVFPFATPQTVGALFAYEHSKSNTVISASLQPHPPTWRELLPTIVHTSKKDDVFQILTVNLKRAFLSYGWSNSIFNASATIEPLNGIASNLALTTRAGEKVTVGTEVVYDPKRSGLKNLTVLALREQCPILWGSDVIFKYSLRNGYGLQTHTPLHKYLDASLISESGRFIVGVQGRSPCGAKIMASTNLNDGSFTFGVVRNLMDMWKMTLSCTIPLSENDGKPVVTPRFGVLFANDLV